jgi:hypothetical protein
MHHLKHILINLALIIPELLDIRRSGLDQQFAVVFNCEVNNFESPSSSLYQPNVTRVSTYLLLRLVYNELRQTSIESLNEH